MSYFLFIFDMTKCKRVFDKLIEKKTSLISVKIKKLRFFQKQKNEYERNYKLDEAIYFYKIQLFYI